jgi:hypothetical protein
MEDMQLIIRQPHVAQHPVNGRVPLVAVVDRNHQGAARLVLLLLWLRLLRWWL